MTHLENFFSHNESGALHLGWCIAPGIAGVLPGIPSSPPGISSLPPGIPSLPPGIPSLLPGIPPIPPGIPDIFLHGLACADTSKDLDYIAGVERDRRTLWKAMENSPKRTNMYLSLQEELKSLRLQDQSKIVARRLKKACHTRWLSMGQAVDTVYRDLEAVLRTLQSLEKEDTVACGLLTKMHKPKFIGCIYIF